MDKNSVLEIFEVTKEQIIIKVNADDPLTVARHPYLNSNMAYITLTRGRKHIFTVINKDGSTWDFYFGEGGHTIIGEATEKLKRSVLEFINDNNIPIEYCGGTPVAATVYYNKNYQKWQLTVETTKKDFHFWADKATDMKSAMKVFGTMVKAKEWKHDIAVTGIDVWRAHEPRFTLR